MIGDNWKIGFASFRTKQGFTFHPIKPKDWTPEEKLLETAFMFTLNQKARRKDTRLESFEYKGKKIKFYYFGERLENPTLVLFEGEIEGFRHLLLSLAIKRREREKRIGTHKEPLAWSMDEVVKSKKARIAHVLSHPDCSFIYLTLLKQGSMFWSDLLEACEELNPIPSSVDIREHLLLLNGVKLAGYTTPPSKVRELVKPRKILLPQRIPFQKVWKNINQRKLNTTSETIKRKTHKQNLKETAKEMSFITALLLDKKARRFFTKAEKTIYFNHKKVKDLLGEERIQILLEENYITKIVENDTERIYPLFFPILKFIP